MGLTVLAVLTNILISGIFQMCCHINTYNKADFCWHLCSVMIILCMQGQKPNHQCVCLLYWVNLCGEAAVGPKCRAKCSFCLYVWSKASVLPLVTITRL